MFVYLYNLHYYFEIEVSFYSILFTLNIIFQEVSMLIHIDLVHYFNFHV